MAKLSKVDSALQVLKYMQGKKQARLDDIAKRIDKSKQDLIYIAEEQKYIDAVNTVIRELKMTNDAILGKMPPKAVDLEEAILGAIMLENKYNDKVFEFLRTEHFYDAANQEVYTACKWLFDNGVPIDMRIVVAQLRSTGKIEQVGGAAYIAELTAKVSSAANLEYHARILIEYAGKRELIRLANELLFQGYDDNTDVFKLIEFAEAEVIKINYLMTDKPFERLLK